MSSDKLIKPVITAFTLKTILHTITSSALLDRLKQEQQNTTTDIYIGTNAASLYLGNKEHIFAPVTNTTGVMLNFASRII